MQEFIRQHRQLLAIFIFLVIGFPMLFWTRNYTWNHIPNEKNKVAIGKVGTVPLEAADFQRMIQGYRRTKPDGHEPTFQELEADGTVNKIIDRMIDGAVITNLNKQRNFSVDKELLTRQLKDLPDFKDDKGEFDKKLWNEWVSSPEVNWNDIYQRIQDDISRKVFIDMALAPAGRVSDAEVNKDMEKKYTTLKVKYYKVDPPVEPTDEQIKAAYDKEASKTDGKPKYKKPDSYVVDYVAFSLQAPVPQLALDLVKQAREGGDFAALADANSALKVKNGGEMGGWQREMPTTPDSRKPLFALKPGEVSEPIAGATGYYIYKVEEEQTAADGVREVKGRQILIESKLDDAAREKVTAQAKELSDKAKAAGSLKKAVDEINAAGGKLEIKRTEKFDRETPAIAGIGTLDAMRFKSAIETQTDDKKYDLIDTGKNGQATYVAEVVEKTEGPVPPLEEVKEQVKKDVIRDLKAQEDYTNKVKDYAKKIKEQVKNIDEIPAKFPELTGTVGESDEFKVKEFIVKVGSTTPPGDRPFIPSEKVADALEGKEVGGFAGPVAGFSGNDEYFVQLVDRKPPTDEDRKSPDWEKEKKQARDQRVNQAKSDLMEDLTKDLKERTKSTFNVELDQNVLGQMLERDRKPAADGKAAEAPAAPAESAPAK